MLLLYFFSGFFCSRLDFGAVLGFSQTLEPPAANIFEGDFSTAMVDGGFFIDLLLFLESLLLERTFSVCFFLLVLTRYLSLGIATGGYLFWMSLYMILRYSDTLTFRLSSIPNLTVT